MQFANNKPNVNNIGYFDAIFRLSFGVAALVPTLFQLHYVALEWVTILALSSIYPLVTALCRWDPIYQYFNLDTSHGRIKPAQAIERFLDESKRYLSTLPGISNITNTDPAANDRQIPRKTA